jgi:uncharacterized protein YggE
MQPALEKRIYQHFLLSTKTTLQRKFPIRETPTQPKKTNTRMTKSTSPTLEITGYSKMTFQPEIVTIEAKFSEKDARSEEALLGIARRVQKTIDSIQSTNLTDLEIRTTSPDVEALTRYTDEDEEQHVGYAASQTIYATIGHTSDAFAALARAVVESNTAPEISASFALKNPAAVGPQLMALAVQDARQKADAIAAACGHRVLGLQEARDASAVNSSGRHEWSSRQSNTRSGRLFAMSGPTTADESSNQPDFNSQPRDLVFQETLHCTFAMAW